MVKKGLYSPIFMNGRRVCFQIVLTQSTRAILQDFAWNNASNNKRHLNFRDIAKKTNASYRKIF